MADGQRRATIEERDLANSQVRPATLEHAYLNYPPEDQNEAKYHQYSEQHVRTVFHVQPFFSHHVGSNYTDE